MQEGGGITFDGRPKDRGSWPGDSRGPKNLLVLVSEKMEVAVVSVPSERTSLLRTRTPQSMGWLLIFHLGGTRSAH